MIPRRWTLFFIRVDTGCTRADHTRDGHVLLSIKDGVVRATTPLNTTSTSWQYGGVSPARYPMPKKPTKRGKKKDDVVREAAQPPTKIYKEAREKAAAKRKDEIEKKKDEELNQAARELDALLASVPPELPSYEEMIAKSVEMYKSLPPQPFEVKLAEGRVHHDVPLEPTPLPAPEPVPPPPPVVSPSSSRSSPPPLIQSSGDVLCPFHATPLTGGVSKNGTPYLYCRDHDKVCPLFVMGADRVQTWIDAIEAQLHADVRRGPWHCYHQKKARLSRTVNPESPNKGRFFLACRQVESCKFFQWVDLAWGKTILKRRAEGYDHETVQRIGREEQTKFQRDQDMIKRTRWWCELLETTQPITPELLKACFMELKSHLTSL